MNENIVETSYQNKKIYLVKTAHVSRNSIQDVIDCVEEINPDTIAIELDNDRYQSLMEPDKWRQQDISKIIKEHKVAYLLVNIILASFQRRMAKSMDSNTGGEMLKGIELAKERNLELSLIDRPIKTTFSRIWSKLGFKEKIKLLTSIIMSIFDDEDISEEELQNLKESDALETALNEVAKEFPNMKKVLVDERDAYLCQKIKNCEGNTIVAIIGAAHANGIIRNLDKEVDLAELEKIEKKFSVFSIIKWLIPLSIIGIIAYTIIANKEMGLDQIKSWILWNGSLSAIGVIIARGHILSILTAFIMAPITSLNPLLAAGWFAGLTEALINKPKVKDFEDIANDTMTFRGFFKNQVTRILLIVILANVFSSIATFISGIDIISTFINIL